MKNKNFGYPEKTMDNLEESRYSSLIQNHATISEQNKEKLASEFKLSELKNAIKTLKNITQQAQMASLINFWNVFSHNLNTVPSGLLELLELLYGYTMRMLEEIQ